MFDAPLATSWVGGAAAVAVAALIAVAGWFAAGAAANAVRRTAHGPVADLAARAVRWAVLAVVLVAVLGRLGVQTASLVALLGAAGLTIGLALQSTLSNVAAGAMLLALRPFRVGDAVEVAGVGGVVEEVGAFKTRLRTWDGVVVYPANDAVWSGAIRNLSQATRRRLDLEVGVAYEGDVDEALRVAREVLEADDAVLEDPAPEVHVTTLAASSVTVRLRAWTAPDDLYAVSLRLPRAVKLAFDAADVAIPYPQREVRLVRVSDLEG